MMKFTDLDFDCLECVLEHLELPDLLNVADTSKRLNKAAGLVFTQKHGNKIVRFDDFTFVKSQQPPKVESTQIKINNIKIGLQLLRTIGYTIRKIHYTQCSIMYDWKEEIERYSKINFKLFEYINNYCAEYLKGFFIYPALILHFEGVIVDRSVTSFQYFTRAFPNLILLILDSCIDLKENCCQLLPLFPKLHELQVDLSYYSFFDANTKHFPHLEVLRMKHVTDKDTEMLLLFLKLNPQLKEFSIDLGNCNLDLAQFQTAAGSSQIEYLKLDLVFTTFINDVTHMKSVKNFDIRFTNAKTLPESFLPFSFQQLDTLSVRFPKPDFLATFTDEFFDFIARHPKITHLTIGNVLTTQLDWVKLAESMPSLVSVTLYLFIPSSKALDVLDKLPMLKQFQFVLIEDDYESFRRRMSKKWKVYQHGWLVELKR